MRSLKAVAGALAVLLGVALAVVFASAFANAPEIIIHIALGAGFLLFAFSAFDFRMPQWMVWIAFAAIGTLGLIFALQAAAELTQDASLHRLAFEELGQRLEKILGYAFLLWCVALLVCDSRGWARILGAILLAIIVTGEVYGFVLIQAGSQAPEVLKLLYLPLFAWLLLEGARNNQAERPVRNSP